jgi:hypothetical protein
LEWLFPEGNVAWRTPTFSQCFQSSIFRTSKWLNSHRNTSQISLWTFHCEETRGPMGVWLVVDHLGSEPGWHAPCSKAHTFKHNAECQNFTGCLVASLSLTRISNSINSFHSVKKEQIFSHKLGGQNVTFLFII